jgi:hypothetical protein
MSSRVFNIVLVLAIVTGIQTISNAQSKDNSGLSIVFKEYEDKFSIEERQLIDNIIVHADNKVRSLLPKFPKNIKVIVSITDENVNQLGGVNGRTESNNPPVVIVEVSKVYPGGVKKAIETALSALVFHEFHHLYRGWAIQDNKFGQGISIASVNEGMAVVFSEIYTGVTLEGNIYTSNADEWAKEIIKLPKNANYSTWMFRHPDGRSAVGYRAGSFIIRKVMASTGKSILELSDLGPAEILKMAGYLK